MIGAVEFRPYRPTDLPLVRDSWMRSLWDAMTAPRRKTNRPRPPLCTPDVYVALQPLLIARLLELSGATVAHVAGSEDLIIGYCAGTGGVLHYVFVKDTFRRLGIGKALINQRCGKDSVDATHWTYSLDRVVGQSKRFSYNPFLLMEPSK